MSGNNSGIVFETTDGFNYNEALDTSAANTVGESIANRPFGRTLYNRFTNAPSGYVVGGPNAQNIEQDTNNFFNVTSQLTSLDRTSIYFNYTRRLVQPLYGYGADSRAENDESYFSYLKGYVGAFLYDAFGELYSVEQSVNVIELYALQFGTAFYQTRDALETEETFSEAVDDFKNNVLGFISAYNENLEVRSPLLGQFVKVSVSGGNYVFAGIGLDGQFKVLTTADVVEEYINLPGYAPANFNLGEEEIVDSDTSPTPQTNEELIGLNATQSAKISANVYNGLEVDTNNNIGYVITSLASNTTSNYFKYTVTHATKLGQLFSAAANDKFTSGATTVQYTGSTADYDDAERQRYKGVVSYVADGVYSGGGFNTDTWTFTITTTFTPGDKMGYVYYPDGDNINNPALAEIEHTFQSRTDTYTVVQSFDYNVPSASITAQDVPVDVPITVGQQIAFWFGD